MNIEIKKRRVVETQIFIGANKTPVTIEIRVVKPVGKAFASDTAPSNDEQMLVAA